jgi:hypothetical protein
MEQFEQTWNNLQHYIYLAEIIQLSLYEWSPWNNSTGPQWSMFTLKSQNQKTAEIQLDQISEWLMFIGYYCASSEINFHHTNATLITHNG